MSESARSFVDFKSAILKYDGAQFPTDDFKLGEDVLSHKRIEEFYIPFDWINTNAKLIVVGITPGLTQWLNGVKTAKGGLERGMSDDEILREVKQFAAFSGTIRPNLLRLMDSIGIPKLLGIDSSEQLFSDRADLVHWTSLFVNPIFCESKNYSGSPAPSLKCPLMNRSIEEGILREIEACKNAWILPVGKPPNDIFKTLIKKGRVPAERVLLGMIHPSNASAERVACWLGTKTTGFSVKTDPVKILDAKQKMIDQVNALIAK